MQVGTNAGQTMYEMGDLFLVEEEGAFTLYTVVETLMHPSPGVADSYDDQPYYFDALTGVMRVFKEMGRSEANAEGLDKLLALV